MWTGRTKVAEYPELCGRTMVTVVYSIIPPVLTFAPSTQGTVAFFTSVSNKPDEAVKYYKEGERERERERESLCMYVCVCVFICVCVYICSYVHVSMYVFVLICVCVCVHVYMCVCVCVCVCVSE